jgi:ankyrin repeat protein
MSQTRDRRRSAARSRRRSDPYKSEWQPADRCRVTYPAIARLLLSAGADLNLRNAARRIATMTRALFDRREIIDFVLSTGSDLGAVDAAGNGVLRPARIYGDNIRT